MELRGYVISGFGFGSHCVTFSQGSNPRFTVTGFSRCGDRSFLRLTLIYIFNWICLAQNTTQATKNRQRKILYMNKELGEREL